MAIVDPVQRLRHFPLFKGLSPEALRLIGGLAEERSHRLGETLFLQGQPPTSFLMVESGQVLETGFGPSGASILRLQANPGAVLGRWSVFNNEAHQTTALVTQDAKILAIPVAEFLPLLTRIPLLRQRLGRSEAVGRLRAIPLFSCFTEEQLFHVADLSDVVEFASGATIYRKGELGDAFYVVDSGRVIEDVTRPSPPSPAWPRYMSAGAFFGQHALMNATARQATATAETVVKAFRFGPDAFQWLRQLAPDFNRALAGCDVAGWLRQAPLFAQLAEADRKLLAGYVGLAHFPKGHTIFYQGEIDPTFYFLCEGEAVEYYRDERAKDRPADRLTAGKGVGERCLFFEEAWGFTLRATTATSWLYLCRDDLIQFLARRPDLKAKLAPASNVTAGAQGKNFDWVGLDEQQLLLRRRHLVALAAHLLGWPGFLWVAIPTVVLVLPLGALLNLLPLLILGLWLLWCVIDYANDYLVVTTKRVVAREKVLWLFEKLYEVPLAKVQNVGFQQNFLGNLLGFGKLTVDTAATSGVQPLSFTYLTDPEGAKSLILEAADRLEQGRLPKARRTIRAQVEASTQPGIRPDVPKPVAPPTAVGPDQVKQGVVARAYGASVGRLFWIEKKVENEITWRKHPLRLIIKVAAPTLIALALILAFVLLPGGLLGLPVLLLLLVPLGFWWWFQWADWGNDLYIVTQDRIIDTEKLPLGLRSRKTEAPFDRIQNVTYELPNLIANLLNFGTVSIFTAGVEGKLDFPYVRDPRKVQAEIFRRLAAYEEEQRAKQQGRTDLAEWFGVYQQTR